MDNPRLVLLVESDTQACRQMRGILDAMGVDCVEAADVESAVIVGQELIGHGRVPDAIVSRVTLPDGSGVQALTQLSEFFPQARQVLVSHFPRRLLSTIPGFADRQAEFIQAAFTDDQFRRVMERTLAKRRTA